MDNAYNYMTTEFVPVKEDFMVFSTKKSLNERFTPQYRRCVFVINNGYTSPFKCNKVKDRMVIRSRAQINTHSRFSLYTKYYDGNAKEEIRKNEPKTKLKELLHQAVKKRRVVLLPAKKKSSEQPMDCQNGLSKKFTVFETNNGISPIDPNLHEKSNTHQVFEVEDIGSPISSRNVRSSKRFQNCPPNFRAIRSAHNYRDNYDESEPVIYSERDNFRSPTSRHSIRSSKRFQNSLQNFRAVRSTRHYDDNYDESEPIIYSSSFYKNNENCLQSLYTWSKAPVTKEDLDRELDSYMAEVHFKPQPTVEEDNVDSFVQEFILESEKYFNGEEENEDIDVTY